MLLDHWTDGLAPLLQRAFDPSLFEAIETPGPDDWLANHEEVGQTYGQYCNISFPTNSPTANRRTIYLQPLGDFSKAPVELLPKVGEFATAFFCLPVQVLKPLPLDGLPIRSRGGEGLVGKKKRTKRSRQKQLLSTDILSWLRTRFYNISTDAYCLLAVTMVDLYPDPTWNFVFGQASLRDRVGVYSFARYDPAFYREEAMDLDDDVRNNEDAIILERSCKVLAHETCHMFCMQHCVYYRCIMNGSNHLAESDSRPMHLCPVCLRKLHHLCQFNVLNRYRSLKQFADTAGWVDESVWLSGRIRWLSP